MSQCTVKMEDQNTHLYKSYCQMGMGKISYEVSGKGPPLMMIMGYLARGSGWATQRTYLEQFYRVLTFDHLGVGDSVGESPTTMEGFVQVCLALFTELGWESAHVVGVSMGGMIAQNLALQAPQRVRSLCLIVTHAGGMRSVIPPLRGLPYFLKLQCARSSTQRHQALLKLLIPLDRLALLDQEDVLRQIAQDFSPLPARKVRLRQLRAVLSHRCKDRLIHLKQPTLIISADQDDLVAPQHQRRLLTYIPHATLIRYPNAGHGLIRQQDVDLPQQLAKHIEHAELSWTRV